MAKIPLSQKSGRGKFTLVDDWILPLLPVRKWGFAGQGYVACSVKAKRVYLHRIVHQLAYGFDSSPGFEIDHIDRNKLNNLAENLRCVPSGINHANSEGRKNKHGLHGIYFHRQSGLWSGSVNVAGVRHRAGYHKTKEGAALAINALYRVHYPMIRIPNPSVEP